MRQWLVGVVGLVIVGSLMGASAWFLLSSQAVVSRTERDLTQAQLALEQTKQRFEDLEAGHTELLQARAQLAASYESAQREWQEMSAELKRINTAHTRASRALEAAEGENGELADRLEATRSQTEALHDELDALVSQNASLHDAIAEYQETLAAQPQISAEELEQLTARLTLQQARAQAIEEWLLDVSFAYDRLLEETLVLDEATPGVSGLVSTDVSTTGGNETATQRTVKRLSRQLKQRARRLGSVQRSLGEAFLALHNYPEAIQAFEQSLTFRDDPKTHAQLALLYGRFLHNPTRARHHAARATGASLASAAPTIPRAQGLPRDGAPLFRQWILK